MTGATGIYVWAFLLSIMPVSEIRGAIIFGVPALGSDFVGIVWLYILSVIGNFLPVPFIMLLFRPIIRWLKKTKIFGRLAHWLEQRTHRKASSLKKASAVALCIFVAIPFPTTGAWTGAMIASLLDMRFKYAFPAIFAGIMISGLIMVLLMTGILNLGALGHLFGA